MNKLTGLYVTNDAKTEVLQDRTIKIKRPKSYTLKLVLYRS